MIYFHSSSAPAKSVSISTRAPNSSTIRTCLIFLALVLTPSFVNATVAKTVTYYLTDQQGNVLATTDESGNVTARFDYRPYGPSALSDTPSNAPGYGGHVEDSESTFSYMQARFNDLQVGRFLSVDPFKPSPGDVMAFNRYAYASNNPIVNIDPSGMDDCAAVGDTGQKPCQPTPSPTAPAPSPKDAIPLPVVTVTVPVQRTLPRITVIPVPLIVAQAAVAGLFFVDSNQFNELVFDHHSCYGSISCGVASPVAVHSLPAGVWPADKGAEEWGRRNGVGKNEGRRRFHDIKQGDDAHSGGKADWGVNPETGDVYDPEGEVHGNLGE